MKKLFTLILGITACSYSFGQSVLSAPQLDGSIEGIKNPDCAGDSSGYLAAEAHFGSQPYSFFWSTGQTTTNVSKDTLFNVPANTNICVTITDQASPDVVVCTTLTDPPEIQKIISSTVNSVLCHGDTTADAFVDTVYGGTPNYSFEWSTGDTIDIINNITGGTYYITITDDNGCEVVDSAVIATPDQIDLPGTVTNESYLGNDGAIDLIPAGGTPSYAYMWSYNSETTEDISGLTGGTYTVTLTDANGCEDSATFTLTSAVGINSTSVSSQVNIFPNPSSGIITVNTSGELNGYSFVLYTSTGSQVVYSNLNSANVNIDLSSLAKGIYLLQVRNKTEVLHQEKLVLIE